MTATLLRSIPIPALTPGAPGVPGVPGALADTAITPAGPDGSGIAISPQRGDTPRLAEDYRGVRNASTRFASRLRPEDMVIQTMPDASPTKWHLAHTTWFFERFLLQEFVDGYTPHHPRYEFLFNSYYNTVGPMHCRANRGAISRPDVAEVLAYREAVDAAMLDWLDAVDDLPEEAKHRLTVGLHHEQQHQELMVTDLKYTLSTNPLLPPYHEITTAPGGDTPPLAWVAFPGGLVEVGRDEGTSGDASGTSGGGEAFGYDNESPRHRVYLEPYELADRPVSNGEYKAFIADGGYTRHDLWLAEGWSWVNAERITHPLYWYRDGDAWWQYTLAGPRPVDDAEPVVHLSFFEAEAFARWADGLYPGARLPTEFEWEHAAADQPVAGHFADSERFHPLPMTADTRPMDPHNERLFHLFGTAWEWTRSAYGPYPNYRPAPGALGEYNGKFMANQYVLRGGSVATPPGHVRPSYRNFFNATARWQFTTLRLAKSAKGGK